MKSVIEYEKEAMITKSLFIWINLGLSSPTYRVTYLTSFVLGFEFVLF